MNQSNNSETFKIDLKVNKNTKGGVDRYVIGEIQGMDPESFYALQVEGEEGWHSDIVPLNAAENRAACRPVNQVHIPFTQNVKIDTRVKAQFMKAAKHPEGVEAANFITYGKVMKKTMFNAPLGIMRKILIPASAVNILFALLFVAWDVLWQAPEVLMNMLFDSATPITTPSPTVKPPTPAPSASDPYAELRRRKLERQGTKAVEENNAEGTAATAPAPQAITPTPASPEPIGPNPIWWLLRLLYCLATIGLFGYNFLWTLYKVVHDLLFEPQSETQVIGKTAESDDNGDAREIRGHAVWGLIKFFASFLPIPEGMKKRLERL